MSASAIGSIPASGSSRRMKWGWVANARAISHRLAQIRRRLGDLQNSPNILLDGEPAKDRGFLRQVADAETGAAIHRKIGDITAVQAHYSGIGADEPGY